MVRFSRVRLAAVPMCHPQVIKSRQWMRHDGGNTLQYQDHYEGRRALPLKAMECEKNQKQWKLLTGKTGRIIWTQKHNQFCSTNSLTCCAWRCRANLRLKLMPLHARECRARA